MENLMIESGMENLMIEICETSSMEFQKFHVSYQKLKNTIWKDNVFYDFLNSQGGINFHNKILIMYCECMAYELFNDGAS